MIYYILIPPTKEYSVDEMADGRGPGNIDRKISELDEKINKITQMLSSMQDTFLSLKASLETINQEDLERNQCAQFVASTNKGMNTFLKGKNSTCNLNEWCTKILEQSATKIIHTYLEKGIQAAEELIDYYTNVSLKKFDVKQCPDEKCYKNAVDMYKGLRELLESSRNASIHLPSNPFLLGFGSNHKELSEHVICDHLMPLSNVTRLRILKILAKGGQTFAFLERETGIIAGHLRFHLTKLVTVEYIKQEKPHGRYLISRNGLKALQAAEELCTILF